MTTQEIHYRAFFRAALAGKMARDSSYSMGALSARAGISRSFLSEVMSGRKNLSTEAGLKIARQLELDAVDTEYFSLLIQLETAKDPDFRKHLLQKLEMLRPSTPINDLSLDLFRTISDWYHLAILDLTQLKGFRFTASNVARELGIDLAESQAAIDRLLRLELLETDPARKIYKKTRSRLLVEAKAHDGAVTKFHRQILARAMESLERQGPKERKGRSDVFPLDPDDLGKAEAILDRAAEELISLSLNAKNKSAVYALGVQLFNLTEKRK